MLKCCAPEQCYYQVNELNKNWLYTVQYMENKLHRLILYQGENFVPRNLCRNTSAIASAHDLRYSRFAR